MEVRRSLPRYRQAAVVAGVALLATCLGARAPVTAGAARVVAGAVRVDQVGYAAHEPKRAFLLAEAPAGARILLTQTGPSELAAQRSVALAAWQAHLDRLARRLQEAG